jgi:hypothetical protein
MSERVCAELAWLWQDTGDRYYYDEMVRNGCLGPRGPRRSREDDTPRWRHWPDNQPEDANHFWPGADVQGAA